MLKVMLSLSTSVAVTVPIAVWFSSILNDELEVKTGDSSSKLFIVMVMSCVVKLPPSTS